MKDSKEMLLIKIEDLVPRRTACFAEAAEEGGTGSEASAVAGMKRVELVSLAAAKLAGRGWLPEPLKVVACA